MFVARKNRIKAPCKVYRSKSNLNRNGKKQQKFKIQAVSRDWLSEESTSEDDFEPVFCLNRKDGSIRVAVNGQNVKMLVDTGSKQNIISSRLYKALFRSYELHKTKKIFTAYGQQKPLKCLGYFHATLRSGINCIDSKVYVIDGEAESLLGRESSFNLQVIKLINTPYIARNNSYVRAESNENLDVLLSEFSDLFQGVGNVTNYEHKIKIDPKIAPVSQKLRRIPLSQVEKVNAEIDKMPEADIIEEAPEASPWVSNLVVVPKKDGCIRVCCDFRDVNKAIIRERYVLPKVEDTLNSMHGSKFFAKIDAKSGFFQMTLAEESRYLTTFITPKGCYRFKRACTLWIKWYERVVSKDDGTNIIWHRKSWNFCWWCNSPCTINARIN